MANNADLILRLLFEDKASSGLQKFGKTMAGVFSAAAVVEFGRQSVLAFAEAEKAQLKLSDAYARFPAMSNIALDALREYNSELMRKTGFDDDAIASGQAVLAQFKLTGQQIKDITPLLIDFAAKMDIDVAEAAKRLGKASLGNTRALKDLGIGYKATGNQALDFANIQKEVAARVGGFAEREAESAAGQLRKLSTLYGEVQESIGMALVPMLDELVTGMQQVAEVTQESAQGLDAWWKVSDKVNASLAEAKPLWGQVLDVMSDPGFASFQFFEQIVPGLGSMTNAAELMAGALDDAAVGANNVGSAANESVTPLSQMQDQLREGAMSAEEYTAAVKDLQAALDRLGGKTLDLSRANSALQEAYDAATAAAKENGKTLNRHTAEGRANIAALEGIVTAADEATVAYAENGKSVKSVRGMTADARAAFLSAADAMGASDKEARRLANAYGLIPKKVATEYRESGLSESRRQADLLAARLRSLDGSVTTVYVNTVTGGKAIIDAGGGYIYNGINIPSLGIGGRVTGPGGPTDDRVPAWLSNGEYVVRAAAVKQYGVAFLNAVNNGEAIGLAEGTGELTDEQRKRRRQRRREYREWIRGLSSTPGERGAAVFESVGAQYQDQLDALRQAADDAQSAADAAQSALNSALDARKQYVDSVTAAFKSAAGVNGIGVSSEDDIFAARRALNQALGTEDEAEARKNLADAQKRSTPGYVLGEVNKKLRTMKSFAANLKKMAAMGYPVEILRDLLQQGMDGARMAEILASADPGIVEGFRQAQAAINDTAGELAAFGLTVNPQYDRDVVTAQGNFSAASALAGRADDMYRGYAPVVTPIQTSIYIDGRAIIQALQDYKRSTGGAPLGLS